MRRIGAGLLACLALAAVAGCNPGYLLQAAVGHLEIMRTRQPVEAILADAGTAPTLSARLRLADEALVFARVHLDLPASRSYRHYAALGRDSVVWNVFAAPEFSLEPRTWCFPVAGCVAYRGWFKRARAERDAAQLAARGHDVWVGGATAYSTLGWFADPLLDTMLTDDPTQVAGLLFHELAHQRLFVGGDTEFDESFATFVAEEGTRHWLAFRGDAAGRCRFDETLLVRHRALALLEMLRDRLTSVYASTIPDDRRREERSRAFRETARTWDELVRDQPEAKRFAGWFEPVPNNARLAALLAYEGQVPAFRALFARSNGDFAAFYAAARQLGARPAVERKAELAKLSESAAAGSGCRAGCSGSAAVAGPQPAATPAHSAPGCD
jgi:predicted aminopeptidase